jgi:hypothetical protein
MTHYFRAFIICATYCTLCAGIAFADRGNVVPGDYDADGRSDIVVTRKVGGLWHWYFRLATGEQLGPVPFGLESDTLLPGDFDGDGDFSLNVIRDADGFLSWYALENDASISQNIWGLSGDIPLTGFFGGSGENERVAVRNVGGSLVWYIENIAPNGISWGLDGDTPFAADITGDGVDELIVLRSEAGQLVWYIRDLSGNFTDRVFWGLDGDNALTPADYNGDGKADINVVRAQNGFNVFYLRYSDLNDTTQTVVFGLDSDVPYVGNFTQSELAELAVTRSADGFTSHFVRFAQDGTVVNVPFGVDSDTVVAPEGGALTEITSSTPGCVSSPGTPTSFVDGAGGGALWKPVSEGVGNRAPVILLPLRYAGSPIVIYGADGTVVSGIQRVLNGGHNGNRAHFWLSATAGQLAPFAPLTVSIVNDGQTECRVVPNPQARYD